MSHEEHPRVTPTLAFPAGVLELELTRLPRPAQHPRDCALPAQGTLPSARPRQGPSQLSLFRQRRVRGWWPCTVQEGGKQQLSVGGGGGTQGTPGRRRRGDRSCTPTPPPGKAGAEPRAADGEGGPRAAGGERPAGAQHVPNAPGTRVSPQAKQGLGGGTRAGRGARR